ncbi:hypothetical protein D0C16_13525 [Cellvibrio sp. KY-GH-1]|nr:hypothetical protein D0C16_13525 [Cellvibrio sp. KY-GH-1]
MPCFNPNLPRAVHSKNRRPKKQKWAQGPFERILLNHTGLRDLGRNPEQRIQKSPIKGLLDLSLLYYKADSLQLSGENREFPFSLPAFANL